METSRLEEVFRVASCKDLTETGGGHNQKGVDFQRAWALARMFELEKKGAQDFLFLFETIQDVAELDSSTSPSSICIYQVKKKDRGEWKWKELTNFLEPGKKKSATQPASDIKDSPIGKLYSSVLAFKQLKSSGRFVSNNGCDLPLEDGMNAATSLPCDLSRLEATYLELLSKGLETLHDAGSLPANPSLIYVERVPVHPDAPAIHLRGLVVSFLTERSSRHAGQASALVDALLAKVGPLGAKTDSCSSFEELQKERGYSRKEFVHALGTLEQVPDQEGLLELWLSQLASEGGADFMEIASIRVAASRIFKLQVMGGEDPLANALIADCDKWLETNSPGSVLKDFIGKAKTDLASLHPSFRSMDFIAYFLLRVANKCVDQI
jgi:hypothetical protein